MRSSIAQQHQLQESDSDSSECSSSGSESTSDDSSPPPVKSGHPAPSRVPPSSDESGDSQSTQSESEEEEVTKTKGRGRGRGRGRGTRLGGKRGVGRAPKGRVEKLKPVRTSRSVFFFSNYECMYVCMHFVSTHCGTFTRGFPNYVTVHYCNMTTKTS